jgi:hypothetical protein
MNKGAGAKAEWVTRKLGDICEIERGGSPLQQVGQASCPVS